MCAGVVFMVRVLGLLLLLATAAAALPVEVDVKKLLEQEMDRVTHYPPARVAWNGPEPGSQPPFNPVYESMMYRVSGEALRDGFYAAATPNAGLLLAFGMLVFLLRLLSRERGLRPAKQRKVTVMAPAVPAAERAA